MTTNEVNSYYQANLSSVIVTVDYSTTHQTIRNFGASDAWNAQLIGRAGRSKKGPFGRIAVQ